MDRREEGRRRPIGGQAPLLVLCVVAGLLVLLGFFIGGDTVEPTAEASDGEWNVITDTVSTEGPVTTAPPTTAPPTTAVGTLVHPVRHPSWISIPSIGVNAPIVSVGLLENGDMETPRSGNVGWYSFGPAPGEPGPAVLIAHVDTYSAPDVFYHLKDVEPGDEILVYGPDGDPAVFEADSIEEQLKIDLPRDRIWYYTSEALIRLITCGGEWDRKSRHYLSNVIVYGHLVR